MLVHGRIIASYLWKYCSSKAHGQKLFWKWRLCLNLFRVVSGSVSFQKNDKTKGEGAGAEPPRHPPITSALSKSSSSEQLLTRTVSTSSLGHTEASSSSFTEDRGSPVYFRDEETTTNTEQETAGEQSPLLTANVQEEDKTKPNSGLSLEDSQIHPSSKNTDCMEDCQQNEQFKNNICSICKNERPKLGWKRDFNYAELQAATEGFAPKNYLSEGGFGSVYRGVLNGLKIAVKQHKSASFQGEKEFKSEVNVLSTARHENLVMLLGSCAEGNRRLLVYEYVCNGSLDQHLSSKYLMHWRRMIFLIVAILVPSRMIIFLSHIVWNWGFSWIWYADKTNNKDMFSWCRTLSQTSYLGKEDENSHGSRKRFTVSSWEEHRPQRYET